MYRLRELIGEDRVNQALGRYYRSWSGAGTGPPYPTSRDLYRELRAVTPDSLRPVLHDLFETVTVWDLHARSARVEAVEDGAPDGPYRVTLEVDARKLRGAGEDQTEVPMDDPVEIALYGREEGGWGRGEEIHRETHRLGSGHQTVVLTVHERPFFVWLDPDKKLLKPPIRMNLVRIDD